ncbi:hypothetical protein [Streptomyces sp. NBC_00328]|uniref:hypothetical protein n=1 Tax=Streptomyces sp. NBC_00328 TaxID=2903646 RepID=UPI002E2C39DF|nr:hypothetical protein [Streptomyces sp. NBC_00328]
MAESVPVRCPACRREHLYAAPSYPCVCGSPVTAPLDRHAEPAPVTHRAWDDEWTTVRCDACGRETQWPHPEVGCPCGTTLRIPLRAAGATRPTRPPNPTDPTPAHPESRGEGEDPVASGEREGKAGIGAPRATVRPGKPGRDAGAGTSRGGHRGGGRSAADASRDTAGGADQGPGADGGRGSGEGARAGRPAFRPVTIRTARDAVTAAALYLGWLGYRDIRRADQRPPSGIGLAARGILAQVDPTVRPASLRDVECLWLTAMTESAGCVFFSLAGYAEDARARADTLGVPLFVLDLTGTPQPVNSPADELIAVTD